MKCFHDEIEEYKEESRRLNREMNMRWGEMAAKMGTMVKDLIWPHLERIVLEVLGQEVQTLMIHYKRRLPDGRVREFDAIAITKDTVCLNSTKSTLRSADVDHFAEEVKAFREFLPEYAGLPLVGILASLSVEQSVLNRAEKQGLLVLGVGDELMEVKNSAGFVPKRW